MKLYKIILIVIGFGILGIWYHYNFIYKTENKVEVNYVYNLFCVEYGDEEYYKGVAVPDCVQHRWFRYDGNESVEVSAYEVENYYKLNK